MRYTGPKVKKARRLGMAFTAKDAKVMQRRPTPPGQHGQNRVRISEYGTQLREKQKMKVNYGIMEKQFRNYFKKALGQTGVTGDNLLKLLETRLDNIVFRSGFAETRQQARQLVSHGFFAVNGKRVNIPSFKVKVGNTIKFSPTKLKSKYVEQLKEKMKNFSSPEWIEVNKTDLVSKLLSEPNSDLVQNTINTQLIVEHYSRI
jgi:small subunit ribosomal protein S4